MTRSPLRLLLCTVLVRTLLPNGKQRESSRARERFRTLAEHPQVILVYVTGRHQTLIELAIRNYQVPKPDYVIADVDSTIYKLEHDFWHKWQIWEDKISHDWQGKTSNEIQYNLNKLPSSERKKMRLQEFSKQNIHKLSYYVPLYVDHYGLIDNINALLKEQNIQAHPGFRSHHDYSNRFG